MAHIVGAKHGVPHGIANGVLLPHGMRYTTSTPALIAMLW